MQSLSTNLSQMNPNNNNSNNNRRRFSLGNLPPLQAQSEFNPTPSGQAKYSFLGKPTQFNSELFSDQTNLPDQRRYSSFTPTPDYSKLLQQQQNQENINNLLKLCNNYQQQTYQDLTTPPEHDSISSSLSSISSASQLFPNQNVLNKNLTNLQNLQNFRRRSFCVGNTLRPVIESRSTSPVFNFPPAPEHLMNQQQQILEQKLNLLANSAFLTPSPSQSNRKLSFPSPALPPTPQSASFYLEPSNSKSRLRSGSLDPASLISQTSNFTLPNSKLQLDSFEEKLATTGNIFQRREDWSILNRLPINKQNTIHIRLEDEGPYGNDETRCFVLSHFSSLGVKELNCIFCSCNLIVYDRFPLVDGTLFVSPYMYDKLKSIPAIVANKQQYIHAVCLDCLNGEQMHQIKCKECKKSWHSIGGFSLQIGTLYKYDVFAAYPCCQKRLNCNKCGQKVMDIEAAQAEYFSAFSEEKECASCKTKAFHFLKPLKDIYSKASCQVKREQEANSEKKKEAE